MAVYKIFPEKSATLYSYYSSSNASLDEILEASIYKASDGTAQVSRTLIKFPQSEISDIFSTKIGTSSYDAYLKLYLADASEIPLNYTLYANPITNDWNGGTGRISNYPATTDGVSWAWRTFYGGTSWTKVGGDTSSLYPASQSFTLHDSKDIEMKVTNMVSAWSSSAITNYGILLKHSSSLEFQTSSVFELKYFSGETHTIYPPCLELRWNDFIWNTGSLSLCTSSDLILTLGNNKKSFQQDSIQRFRVNIRDHYPTRVFQTSSLYLNNKVLPTSSYWSIVDIESEEIIIDYDVIYTKLSSDLNGNYFDIYMNGLQPERYYKILVKTTVDNSTVIFDDNYYFKVIR